MRVPCVLQVSVAITERPTALHLSYIRLQPRAIASDEDTPPPVNALSRQCSCLTQAHPCASEAPAALSLAAR